MEFEIKSCLELNLIVDLLLLLLFSFTVLLRNPKLLIFFIFLNLCQYVILVPDTEILKARRKLQEENQAGLLSKEKGGPSPESKLLGQQVREIPAIGDATQMPQETVKIYDQVLEGLGAEPGAAGAGLEISLNSWKRHFQDDTKDKDFSFNPLDILFKAGSGDLQAAWFLTRLFWLAATFYLYMQRPQIGSTVFAFNLLPVPFLAHFVPYLWFRFNDQKWVKDLNAWGQVGTVPKEVLEFLFFYGAVFLILGLPLFLVMLAALSHWQKSKDTGLRSYLDPSRYDLLMNGTRIPFQVNGNELLAGDFRLNIRQLSYDPENPEIWYLKTGTKVKFVEK